MVCFAHSFEAFVMKISILKEMTQASAQTATQALNKWDWTIGHLKKIKLKKSILFPTQILNKQAKQS